MEEENTNWSLWLWLLSSCPQGVQLLKDKYLLVSPLQEADLKTVDFFFFWAPFWLEYQLEGLTKGGIQNEFHLMQISTLMLS